MLQYYEYADKRLVVSVSITFAYSSLAAALPFPILLHRGWSRFWGALENGWKEGKVMVIIATNII